MNKIHQELVDMLNQALRLEHAARIQYLAHAELVSGLNAEKIVERLQEIASDEEKHEGKFRELIGTYLGAEPTMEMEKTHQAKELNDILNINLGNEKEAIDFYKKIYRLVMDNRGEFPYTAEKLEHEIRHVIIDEQEHVTELSLLLGL
jgi:rubrerythrin